MLGRLAIASKEGGFRSMGWRDIPGLLRMLPVLVLSFWHSWRSKSPTVDE